MFLKTETARDVDAPPPPSLPLSLPRFPHVLSLTAICYTKPNHTTPHHTKTIAGSWMHTLDPALRVNGGYGNPNPNVVPGEAGIDGACSTADGHAEGGRERLLPPVVAGLGVCGGVEPSFTTAAATPATLGRGVPSVTPAPSMDIESSSSSPALVPSSSSALGAASTTAAVDGGERWQVRTHPWLFYRSMCLQ